MQSKGLPEEWKFVRLENVTEKFLNGGTPSTSVPEYWDGSIPWTTSKSITSNSISSGEKFISESAVANSASNIIPKDNVLIASRVGIGKSAVNLIDIAISQDLTGVLLNKKKILPEYLVRYLHSPKILLQLEANARGSTIKGLQRSDLERIEIPLPPLPIQREIVAILERAEALKRQRQEADALTGALLQSVFYEMFGDPVRNERGWDIANLEEICDEITVGVVVKPASYYVETGIPALRSLNIKPDQLDLTNLVYFSSSDNDSILAKSKIYKEDVVVVRTGYPGTACVVPPELDGANCIDLIILRPKKENVNADYLSRFLNSEYGKAQALAGNTGLAQQHLNVGAIRHVKIPLPPLPLQQQFAHVVEDVERVRQRQVESEKEIEGLCEGLMARAFEGELEA
jgi:type I restriction enzyme S subunit